MCKCASQERPATVRVAIPGFRFFPVSPEKNPEVLANAVQSHRNTDNGGSEVSLRSFLAFLRQDTGARLVAFVFCVF